MFTCLYFNNLLLVLFRFQLTIASNLSLILSKKMNKSICIFTPGRLTLFSMYNFRCQIVYKILGQLFIVQLLHGVVARWRNMLGSSGMGKIGLEASIDWLCMFGTECWVFLECRSPKNDILTDLTRSCHSITICSWHFRKIMRVVVISKEVVRFPKYFNLTVVSRCILWCKLIYYHIQFHHVQFDCE